MRIVQWCLIVVGTVSLNLPMSCPAEEWQWKRIGWSGAEVFSLAAPPDSTEVLYASLGAASMSDESLGVYKSIDGGLAWRFLPESNSLFYGDVSVDPRRQATVYCGSIAQNYDPWPSECYPRRSTDAGEHWASLNGPLSRIEASTWKDSLLFGVRNVGDWSLYRSIDDGASWTYLSSSDAPGMTDNVVFHSRDPLIVNAGWFGSGCGDYGLARSADDGETWEIILRGLVCAFDQDPFDPDHWAASILADPSDTGLFAVSFDNGSTWESWHMPAGIRRVRDLRFDTEIPAALYLVDPIVGYDLHLGVYRSLDGGHNWEPMNTGFPAGGYVGALFQTSGIPSRLLAARNDGLWWWTDQQAGEWADGRTAWLRLEDVGPCPFRERLSGWLVLAHPGYVSAGIYSLDGRLIRTLVDSPLSEGAHTVMWDGIGESGMLTPPGGYVLSVHAGGETMSRVIMKLP